MKKRLIVDGDACPRGVKKTIINAAQEHGCSLLAVVSFCHCLEGFEEVIIVENESQAVDLAIMNQLQKGDIVVTQDWGLAAMVLAKGAYALSPRGIIFNEERMTFTLEERYIKAKHRRLGGRTKGPSPHSKADDQHFKQALDRLIQG